MRPRVSPKRDSCLGHFADLRPIEHAALKFVFTNRVESLKIYAPLTAIRIIQRSQIANELPGRGRAIRGRVNFEGSCRVQFDFQTWTWRVVNRREDAIVPGRRTGMHAFPDQINGRRDLKAAQNREGVSI